MATPQPKVVMVVGRPGSGKGTLCHNIGKKFGFNHLSAGELLRKETNNPQSPDQKILYRCFTEGSFAPTDITCRLLEEAMHSAMAKDSSNNNYLIDGFPSNMDNFIYWESQMANRHQLLLVLHLECDEKICVERCLLRGQSSLTDRSDDTLERITKRMKIYTEVTQPVLDEYTKKGLVKTIDSIQSPQQVFDAAALVFKNIGDH